MLQDGLLPSWEWIRAPRKMKSGYKELAAQGVVVDGSMGEPSGGLVGQKNYFGART